jgi:hypothetical protein
MHPEYQRNKLLLNLWSYTPRIVEISRWKYRNRFCNAYKECKVLNTYTSLSTPLTRKQVS